MQITSRRLASFGELPRSVDVNNEIVNATLVSVENRVTPTPQTDIPIQHRQYLLIKHHFHADFRITNENEKI